MIALEQIARQYGGRILFRGSDESITYAAFWEMVAAGHREIASTEAASLVPLPLAWTAEAFARFFAHLQAGHNVVLAEAAPAAGLEPFLEMAPLLVLRTGGTTGVPRHAVHRFASLTASYVIEPRPPRRILILYAADHIAGLDAFFQALHRGATLVIPPETSPRAIAGCIERERVEVLPATPTFLQFLLLSGELERRDLGSVEAIPHGAEPMPDSLRERLAAVFPSARLLQRFGMTELGALPVRPDPEDPRALFLEGGHAWTIDDGELWIRTPTRMLGTLENGPLDPADAWHRTGDLAELTPRGSVRILGRREAVINVGGAKVIPETVEELILAQPMVRDAAVAGIPNPLTGEAVLARVVFDGPPDPMGLLRALRIAARHKGLSLAHIPTRVEAVESLEKTPIGKRLRQRRGKS